MILDLFREDVLSALGDDDVLCPSGQNEVTIGILITHVTGIEPAILGKDFAGCFGSVVISLHDHGSAKVDDTVSFTVLVLNSDFHTLQVAADGDFLIGLDGIEVCDRACFGKAVTLYEVHTELVVHLEG